VSPAKREAYLRAQHRCLECADKLTYNDVHGVVRCQKCRQRLSLEREVRDERIMELHRAGKSRRQIGAAVGCSQSMANYVISDRARRRGEIEAAAERLRRSQPRCRCGLLLPCNSCVPSIYVFAAQRRGEAAG
jgi:hypothetical protein